MSPGVVLFSRAGTAVGDLGFSLVSTARLRRENRALREECSQLAADRVRLAEIAAENARLRREVGCPLPPKLIRLGVVQVIARTPGPLRRRVTVRAASDVFLAKDDVLLEGGCLAGRVINANGPQAEAVLLVDSEHAVAAVDQRSRDQGMLYAEAPAAGRGDLLRMDKLVGRCDLAPGDIIITSGIGQVYPKGLPIGRVVAVTHSPGAGGAVSALVKPFVDLDRAEFFSVVRSVGAP
ncbi:MAG: rod shape-determining protein MreC [Armatimonadetes bacterium]|nr:rod shape-determining protein MreC [Armatimonadota bacterium]